MKEQFVTKKELALRYFPDSDPRVAVNHLVRWIKGCQPLVDDLNATHMSRWAKTYSPQMSSSSRSFSTVILIFSKLSMRVTSSVYRALV